VHEAQALRIKPANPHEYMTEQHAAAKRAREEKVQENESNAAASSGERGIRD